MKTSQNKGLRQIKGIWYVNIQVDGKRKEFKVGPTKQEAINVRNRLKLMSLNGTLLAHLQNENPPTNAFTFSEAVKEHWEKHLKFKKSGKNLKGRLSPFETLFGNRNVSTLSWQEVEDFRNQRLQEVSASTVKQELDMMHAVLQRQVRTGRIKINALDNVERPKISNVREEIITHAEFINLLNIKWDVDNRGFNSTKTLDNHLRLALVIADYTAMRIGEVLNTKWEHIRKENDCEYIYIPESKNQKKRFVPIHPELSKILAIQEHRSVYVIHDGGKKIKNLKKGFENARTRAGLPWLHMHDLRHRAITRWVQMSFPLSAIMKASGHSTFSAFSRYSNLKDGDVQVLVGRKTEPLPVVTYEEFLGIGTQSVEKVWKDETSPKP